MITAVSPHTLYRKQQIRDLEQLAVTRYGIGAERLMERAGAAALAVLRARWPQARRLAVVCGPGNNAGDGYVLARLGRQAGLSVEVLQAGSGPTRAEALQAAARLALAGVAPKAYARASLDRAELIVDALFGIGLARAVEGAWRQVIEDINAASAPKLALDIPSGLDADTGLPLGVAVRATSTVSFLALKRGFYTAAGADHTGDVVFDDLGIPAAAYAELTPDAELIGVESIAHHLPPRARDTHKGLQGRVLIVGGAPGMAGAALLAAEAALRVGAGLVTLATHPAHATHLHTYCPELMCYGVEEPQALRPLIETCDVIAVGPGLGTSPWAQALYRTLHTAVRPVVVDASALRLYALEPLTVAHAVLTPHPGEAATLLQSDAASVQADRFAAVRALVERYQTVAVLKGSGSLIAEPGHAVTLCNTGNPGLATAGTGDVLTGVIAGLMAQGLRPGDAARTGVVLHGWAGDCAAEQGERGVIARDLFPALRAGVNGLER